MGVVINNLSIVSPRLFPGKTSVIYSVMDSGVDGWQRLTGKLEGKILINHYGLIIEIRTIIDNKGVAIIHVR